MIFSVDKSYERSNFNILTDCALANTNFVSHGNMMKGMFVNKVTNYYLKSRILVETL